MAEENVIEHTHHGLTFRFMLDEEDQLLRWERGRWEPLEPLEGSYIEDLAAREYRAALRMAITLAAADEVDERPAKGSAESRKVIAGPAGHWYALEDGVLVGYPMAANDDRMPAHPAVGGTGWYEITDPAPGVDDAAIIAELLQ